MNFVSLSLYNSVKHNNTFLADVTSRCWPTWHHTKRRIGGDWTASSDYEGDRYDLDDMFLNGLMREVRLTYGGLYLWGGFIGAMTYVRDGVMWTRTLADRANAVKSIYTRIGDNMLSNGGAESGAWTVLNGATVTQSTTWVSQGNYSCSIVVADTTVRGAIIETITVAAETLYLARVSLHVISGSWRVAINRTDNDQPLAKGSTRGAVGDIVITMQIEASSLYAGTANFQITSEGAAGTVYGDAAVVQAGPARAETDWKTDTVSISEYGRLERVLLKAGMSNAAANAEAQTVLADSAWPRSVPPDQFTIGKFDTPDRLSLSLFGYIFTLKFRYSTIVGTSAMSTHIAAVTAQQSDYLSAGAIEENLTDYQIDDRAPFTLWTVMTQIALAGDASGNRWSLGVDAKRHVNYGLTSTEVAYHLRRGLLYNVSSSEYEPYLVEPGWAQLDDVPTGPESLTTNANDVARRIYLEECEFIAPDGLKFKRTADYGN